MIRNATIIEQPCSGHYKERIYDIESPWNSGEWTWIKFLDDEEIWCGEFRGTAKNVVLSEKFNSVFILTTEYLYILLCVTREIKECGRKPQYNSMSVTPRGDVIISDDYSILVISETLDKIKYVELPFEMDMIRFQEWVGNRLILSCHRSLEWENEIRLVSDWIWNEKNNSYDISWIVD